MKRARTVAKQIRLHDVQQNLGSSTHDIRVHTQIFLFFFKLLSGLDNLLLDHIEKQICEFKLGFSIVENPRMPMTSIRLNEQVFIKFLFFGRTGGSNPK